MACTVLSFLSEVSREETSCDSTTLTLDKSSANLVFASSSAPTETFKGAFSLAFAETLLVGLAPCQIWSLAIRTAYITISSIQDLSLPEH